jgi:hemolysin D
MTNKINAALEREFLPAALELVETPAPALPRAVLWAIVAALVFAIGWSFIGRIDLVAVAPGKVIAAGKTKVIQPAEVGVVKRILVADGQTVKAGDVLVELEAAATATGADTARQREALMAARLESARYDALARGTALKADAPRALLDAEARAMGSQRHEQRAKLAELDAEISRRTAELGAVRELAKKLEQTLPIAQRRAEDYKSLVEQKFMSQHGYLEREQARIENERDLAFQRARVEQLAAAVEETRRRRESLVAEFERAAVNAKTDADKRAALLAQELVKAQARQSQQTLVAPVDGVVQQLAVHTVGGVVTPAQTLMVVTPSEYQAEVETLLENRDVGFVKPGQHVEVKVDTFPFTRYGTIPGTVTFVSRDAVADEKRGLVFQARVKLDKPAIRVDERDIALTPGMAVTAEIATDRRRVIDFFLDPIRKTASEALIER